MNKATDVKPGNDRNGDAVDRRRGMKLVASSLARQIGASSVPKRTRPGFNIGVSPNVFSEVQLSSERVPAPGDDSLESPPSNEGPGTIQRSSNLKINFVIGTAAGLLIAGILGFVIGRRKR